MIILSEEAMVRELIVVVQSWEHNSCFDVCCVRVAYSKGMLKGRLVFIGVISLFSFPFAFIIAIWNEWN